MTITRINSEDDANKKKQWGPEREVVITRESGTSLGISIVGGSVDVYNGVSGKYESISGIFIKQITPGSPADRTKKLKAGDRIIQVDGVSLGNCTHQHAVEVIQSAGDPIRFLVQSLEGATGGDSASSRVSIRNRINKDPSVDETQVTRSQPQRSSLKKANSQVLVKKTTLPPTEEERDGENNKKESAPKPAATKYSSGESSEEEEDTRHLEGNVYTKAGREISRKSAGNLKRSKQEIEADPEEEDDFGYTSLKVQKKYRGVGCSVVMAKFEKDRRGLGICLVGHKDRNKMAVFICGFHPNGTAIKTGGLEVADQVVEVNGYVLLNRCHLNASSIIKGIAGTLFKFIVFRKPSNIDELAVKPLTQYSTAFEDDGSEFSQYKGVRTLPVKKGQYGLGIMIIEGKHAEVGQGIFISDIQEGSAAEQAGLQVGDLILAVNFDCLMGSTNEEATSILKKAEGVVRLTVCNPNQKKVAEAEEKGLELPTSEGTGDTAAIVATAAAAKEPEKPKEPEAPPDPKDCKIVMAKDTPIEFTREKDKPIGLQIIGGNDTPSVGVFVLDVYPDGAAGKDGRLKAGDQLMDFCGESFKAIPNAKAYAAVYKAAGAIRTTVYRDEKREEIEVELAPKPGKPLGMHITEYRSTPGAYISEIVPGGLAAEGGKLLRGDRILAVSGDDLQNSSIEDIILSIKASNPVALKVGRSKSSRT